MKPKTFLTLMIIGAASFFGGGYAQEEYGTYDKAKDLLKKGKKKVEDLLSSAKAKLEELGNKAKDEVEEAAEKVAEETKSEE